MTSFLVNFVSILLASAGLCAIGLGTMDRWPRASKAGLILVLVCASISINWLVVADIQRTTLESCAR